MKKEISRKIGDYWSKSSLKKNPEHVRWWEVPTIHKHVNQLICGEPVDGVNKGLITVLKDLGLTFDHGVSVGFGNGQKEFKLLKEGLVNKFTLFELSDVLIETARKQAEISGFENRINFIKGDCFQYEFTEKIDFVHWNNSLHHMFDVDKAVKWSHQILEIGGVFYMDDFVGPTRFQWSDEALELGTRIRKILPDMYLENPYKPGKLLNKTVLRPDAKKLKEHDPSEAADSDRILESVKKYFPNAKITLTGGTVYHSTLNDILHNMDETNLKDKTILNLLLLIDELATKSGVESHYATALGIKSSNTIEREPDELNYQLKHKLIEKNEDHHKKLNSKTSNLTSNIYKIKYLKNSVRSITPRLISRFPILYILLNKENNGIKNILTNIMGYKSIKQRHLFDIGYYLKNNNDVRLSGIDPLLHYMYYGFKEGRKPNQRFDGDYYLKRYGDVRKSNLNPLVHYSLYGINEERDCSDSLN